MNRQGQHDGEQPGSGRDAAAAARCRQIVSAADSLLEEEGLEGLTIRAVLKRTGLARRAFYECFAGKDDLVLAVFEQTLRFAASRFEELGRDEPDPLRRIGLIVTGIVVGRLGVEGSGHAGNKRNAALSREHLRLAESRPAELQAALAPLLDHIAAQVSEGILLGKCRECDPHLQAALIYNLLATTVHLDLLAQSGKEPKDSGKERVRLEGLARDIEEFCRRAIMA